MADNKDKKIVKTFLMAGAALLATGIAGAQPADAQVRGQGYYDPQLANIHATHNEALSRCRVTFNRATQRNTRNLNQRNRESDWNYGMRALGQLSQQGQAGQKYQVCVTKADMRFQQSMIRGGYGDPYAPPPAYRVTPPRY